MLKKRFISSRGQSQHAILAGLVSSFFFLGAFPPYSWWGMALLIPVPLFLLVRNKAQQPTRAAFWAMLGTLPSWGVVEFWVRDISQIGYYPLVLMLSAYTFLFVWLAIHLSRRFKMDWLILPIVWVGVEFFRGAILWGGYPWYLIAHPLINSPFGVLAMPASLFGAYFVSFLAALYAIFLIQAVFTRDQHARLRSGIVAGVIFTAWIGIGFLLLPSDQSDGERIRVGVIQPDVPQDNRGDWTVRQRVRDWLTLRDLTIAASNDPKNPGSLDMIIWPEGFVPGWTLDPVSLEIERNEQLTWTLALRSPDDVPELTNLPSRIPATMLVDELLTMQQALNIPMIVGSVAYDHLRILEGDDGFEYAHDAMYNSVFVIDHGGVDPVWYDKMHLTPFGETMPYISSWDWLEHHLLSLGAEGMDFALDSGKESRVLRVPLTRAGQEAKIPIATPICFEGTIPSVCRDLVFNGGHRRASLMVNLTNDGWFGTSQAGRTTHALAARWRCVELRTPMVRCANTGISCIIGTDGQIETQSITAIDPDDPNEGYLIGDVALGTGKTLYASIGDLFGWACFGATIVLLIASRSTNAKTISRTSRCDLS